MFGWTNFWTTPWTGMDMLTPTTVRAVHGEKWIKKDGRQPVDGWTNGGPGEMPYSWRFRYRGRAMARLKCRRQDSIPYNIRDVNIRYVMDDGRGWQIPRVAFWGRNYCILEFRWRMIPVRKRTSARGPTRIYTKVKFWWRRGCLLDFPNPEEYTTL